MFRHRLEDLSTWKLADRFYRVRLGELRQKRRFSARERESLRVLEILVERYAGLMSHIASRSGMAVGRNRVELADRYIMRSLLKLRDGTYGSAAGVSFSAALWNCLLAQLAADTLMSDEQRNGVQGVKRKFMLRQFVDAMQNSHERTLLRIAIFTVPHDLESRTSGEIKRGLPGACKKLHQTVVKRRNMLAQLTDNAIKYEDIPGEDDISDENAVEVYKDWLVRC
jgi:hypothetical protein